MADKDLRKMKRQDLLELLILQSKEVLRMQDDIMLKTSTIEELTNMSDRLKAKLNEKDEEIEGISNRLKAKLDEKDRQIDHLKEKLDDKDVQLDRLKIRLDQKEAKILKLETHIGEGSSEENDIDDSQFMMQKIYEAAQNAVGLYMKKVVDGTLNQDPLTVTDPEIQAAERAAGLIPEEETTGSEEPQVAETEVPVASAETEDAASAKAGKTTREGALAEDSKTMEDGEAVEAGKATRDAASAKEGETPESGESIESGKETDAATTADSSETPEGGEFTEAGKETETGKMTENGAAAEINKTTTDTAEAAKTSEATTEKSNVNLKKKRKNKKSGL